MSQLLAQFLQSQRALPDAIMLIEGSQRLTYTDIAQQVASIAHHLKAQGVQPGDRVGIMLFNQKEALISLLALRTIGAIVVPINIQMLPQDIAYVIQHAGIRQLIVAPEFLPHIAPLGLQGYVVGEPQDGFNPFDSLLSHPAADLNSLLEPSDPDALGLLIYTSGTSGQPKGVMLSENNILANIDGFTPIFKFEHGDRVVLALPLFHSYGLIIALACLLNKASISLVPKFHPKSILSAAIEEKATILPLVPSLFNVLLALLNKQSDVSFPDLKFCISGGESLPTALLKSIEARLGVPVIEGYGLTETSPVIAVNDPAKGSQPQSVGKVLPNIQVQLLDPQDKPCTPGEEGEICVKGPNIMQGYYQNPQATQETFTSDGWFRTGDLGKLTPDGFLYITGRKKDLIIKAGENIAPKTVEEVLFTHPDIHEVAVFGIPSSKTGESIVACVTPQEGKSLTEADIKSFCREQLSPTLLPDIVQVLPELPKNATGKILKRVLKQSLLDHQAQATSSSA